jgi:hypothetical protein
MDDQKLFDTMCETLYSAVISDTLDQLGYRNQVMRENINPVDPSWVVPDVPKPFCRWISTICPKIPTLRKLKR